MVSFPDLVDKVSSVKRSGYVIRIPAKFYLRAQHNRVYSYFEKGCRKYVHATIPKVNMGYNQYTVSDDCIFRTYFCCFLLALANTFPRPFVPILLNFLKTPTMPFRIVACTFSDNLSRNRSLSDCFKIV